MKITRKIALVGFAAATMLGALAAPVSAWGRTAQPEGEPTTTEQTDGGRIIAQPMSDDTVRVTHKDADGKTTSTTTVRIPGSGNSVKEEGCPKFVIC